MTRSWLEWERELGHLAEAGDMVPFEALLAAHPDARPRVLSTALARAAHHGRDEVVACLLRAGTDPNVLETRSTGRTALLAATQRGQVGVVEQLLAAGADPNQTSWLGESAVHRAALELRVEVLRRLVRAGGYGLFPDRNGETAFHLAVSTLSRIRAYRTSGLLRDADLRLADPGGAFRHLTEGCRTYGALLDGAEAAFEQVRTILSSAQRRSAPAATKLAKKELAAYARDARALKLVKGPNPDPQGTEVRGDAWLPPDRAWPSCEQCDGAAMHLLLRVRCADAGLTPAGQLSIFQCIHYDAASPYGGALGPPLVQVLFHPHLERLDRRAHPNGLPAKPNHVSAAAKPKAEFPGPLQSTPVDWPKVDPEARAVARHLTQDTDKVGGWPATAEPLETPSCSECGHAMPLILQLGGAKSKLGLLGGVDRWFVFQCADHPEQASAVTQLDDW